MTTRSFNHPLSRLARWWVHRRLMWMKWREEHRVYTLGTIGRVANEVANKHEPRGEDGGPRAIHWLAIERFLTELRKR